MRKSLFILPFLLAGLVAAQQGPSAAELVKKLGHADFQVREDATKALIAMGEAAVPALEKAIHDDDVEVRLRAGRALRAIRSESRPKADQTPEAKPERKLPRPGVSSSDMRIEMRDGKVKVTVKETVDGKEEVKEYEGKSLEELRKNHPELKERLKGMDFRVGVARDPFDMEDFWKKWSKDWNDDFFKRWEEETRADMERMRAWMRVLEEQKRRALGQRRTPGLAPAAPLLGVRASRPEQVLDAQLELRGRGLVIDAVEKGSLAEHLGLQPFDILLELNGVAIRSTRDVAQAMRGYKQGDTATAKILRRAKPLELKTSR